MKTTCFALFLSLQLHRVLAQMCSTQVLRLSEWYVIVHSDALLFCLVECSENTYSEVYSYRDEESTCTPCPDINHISPEGSTELRACVCKPGYKAVSDTKCDRVS